MCVLQRQLRLADPAQPVHDRRLHHRRLPATCQPLVQFLKHGDAAGEVGVAGRQVGDLKAVARKPRPGALVVGEGRLADRLAPPALHPG
jgi:hypothetical protein